MPSPRDIRRRIKSVKSTAQITKAMQMVASSRMRRAQQAALAGRPYARLLHRIQREVLSHTTDFTDPLMEVRPVVRRAVILVGTDKGLCGALNSNLFREASRFDPETTVFIAAGRKAAQYLARSRRELVAEFTYRDTPQFAEARAIAKAARDLFTSREVDEVVVLFSAFVNTLSQRPTVGAVLPLTGERILKAQAEAEREAEEEFQASLTSLGEFQFEPNAVHVVGALLPHCINYYMYQVLLEAKASEQSARMVAMKNATDNADQLIKDLTLEYNKIRQAGITKELLEISSAAMSLG
jgi:F-type H+-transporting ATPase subunit gamma